MYIYIINNIVVEAKNDQTNELKRTIKTLNECKVKISENLDNKLNKTGYNNYIQYKIEEDPSTVLKNNTEIVTKIIKTLSKRPDLIYKILRLSKSSSNISNFCTFITEFFLYNFTSLHLEINLMALLYLALKEEIYALSKYSEYQLFLYEDSLALMLLNVLRNQNDVKFFFWNIVNKISEILEKFEDLNVSFNLVFDDWVVPETKEKQKSNNKHENSKESKNKNKIKEVKELVKKEEIEESFNNTFIPITKEYFNEKIKFLSNKEDYLNKMYLSYIFNNKSFLNEECDCKYTKIKEELIPKEDVEPEKNGLALIIDCYTSTKDAIIQFFKLIKDNIQTLPYSIKCLCKIVSILYEQKFEKEAIDETTCYFHSLYKFYFEFKFFCECLIKPFLCFPEQNMAKTSFFLSKNIQDNLLFVYNIIEYICKGELIHSKKKPKFLILFNMFILEIMPTIIETMNLIKEVKLPKYIEKMHILNSYNILLYYDYENENPNENMIISSVLIGFNDILDIYNALSYGAGVFIVSNIDDVKSDLVTSGNDNTYIEEFKNTNFVFQKILDKVTKINDYKKEIEDLCKLDKTNKKKTFLLFEEYEYIKNLQYLKKISTKNKVYTIKQISNPSNDIQTTNLINAKNYLCKILFNFQKMSSELFSSSNIDTLKNIINSLRPFLDSDNYLLSTEIPLDWYGDSLRAIISNIPQKYIENDYQLFIKELIEEINEAFNLYQLSNVAEINNKGNFIIKKINNCKNVLNKLDKLDIEKTYQRYINEAKINVYLSILNINDQTAITFVEKSNSAAEKFKKLNKIIYIHQEDPKRHRLAVEIKDFIKHFPDFNKHSKGKDNIFNYEEKYKVEISIQDFYIILKRNIKNWKPFKNKESKELENIYYEINKYIHRKLYKKLYPLNYLEEDIKIFEICDSLDWLEPKNIISNLNIIVDNFLPLAIRNIKKMEYNKSPINKVELIEEVFALMRNTLIFSLNKNDVSADDFLPLLLFTVIKAKPKSLSSDIKYIELFLDSELQKKKFGVFLAQMDVVKASILNFNYNMLYNISQEEFSKKWNFNINPNENEEDII